MQDLQLSATERTPEIKFSTSEKKLIISGESYPEDVSSFYGELIQISESLSNSDLDSLDVTVSLIYMNSSSVKAFYRIFEGLDKAKKEGKSINLTWECQDDDDIIEELGEDFIDRFPDLKIAITKVWFLSAFDLYDREKDILSKADDIISSIDSEHNNFLNDLVNALKRVVRENEDLTKHADRQERKLFKLNSNLKKQTKELDERREVLEKLSSQLAKYIPPQIHNAIFEGNYDTNVATTRKQLTVFFSDIKNFTSTAESLQPETLTHYLNEYFSEMTAIALKHGATIDKYIGDAMMVFFGDPESKGVKEDARSCVEMALEMREKIFFLQKKWKNEGFGNPFEVRMGINTGYCNVGNFGSDQRLSYTIIGGEVNLTQRLESNADVGKILISFETFVHVKDFVEVEEKPPFRMKGIEREIKTYQIVSRKNLANKNTNTIRIKNNKEESLEINLDNLDLIEKSELIKNLQDALNKIGKLWIN